MKKSSVLLFRPAKEETKSAEDDFYGSIREQAEEKP